MKSLKPFWPMLAILVLILSAGMACNFGAKVTPTSVPPTQAPPPPPPTKVPAPTKAPLPTNPPAPTQAQPQTLPTQPQQSSGLPLSPDVYTHSEGLFTLNPPQGWLTADEGQASVSFAPADDSGFIYFQATNTGYILDADGFTNFIDGREGNFYSDFPAYQESDRNIDPANGLAVVNKTLTYNGVPQRVSTYYIQDGLAIITIDMWADEDKADIYFATFADMLDTVYYDGAPVENQLLYLWVITFTGPNDLFEIDVPTAWAYERSTNTNTIVDTFRSPDKHALIENVTYDDGTQISKVTASKIALDLLHTYYATDIIITDDKVQDDGSERLTWHSPSGDYSGVSFFETRGTTFLLFTTLYDNTYKDIYTSVLDDVVSSYVIP